MESNNLSEREKDYLTNILKAEIELNDHYYPYDPYDSELNDVVQSIMNKLNLKHKNNENQSTKRQICQDKKRIS